MYALRDTSLSDGEFLDRLRIITSVTNFYAGHFEVCDTCWINVQPGPVKRHYKYVVADLYAAYANSKFLFDSTFDYKWSLNAQRQYFDSTLQGKISAGEYIKRMEEDARIGRGESTIDG